MNMDLFISRFKELYSKNQQIKNEKEKRGENYNIFTTLGLWSEEVRLHSAFIANLLDPNGSHGLGTEPLKKFVELIRAKDQQVPTVLNYQSAIVSVEKPIGSVDYEKETGGRLDIEILFVKDKYQIVIENKIYAGDQPSQLVRYRKNAEDNYPNRFCICYLTPDGHNPSYESSKISDEGTERYWINMSYKFDICEWISKCVLTAARAPLIREVLIQYESLIDAITGNTIEDNMKEEYVKYLMEGNNLCLAEELCSAIDETKRKIMETFVIPKLNKYAESNALVFDWNNNGPYFSCRFWLDSDVSLNFPQDPHGMFYSLKIEGRTDSGNAKKLQLLKYYENSKLHKDTYGWVIWDYLEPRIIWNTDLIIKIKNDSTFLINIIEGITTNIIRDYRKAVNSDAIKSCKDR